MGLLRVGFGGWSWMVGRIGLQTRDHCCNCIFIVTNLICRPCQIPASILWRALLLEFARSTELVLFDRVRCLTWTAWTLSRDSFIIVCRDAAIPLLHLDPYVRYLFYTNCPLENYPVHVTSEFRMNNFLSLTGIFLSDQLLNTIGDKIIRIFICLFLIDLTTLLVTEYVWCI